MTKSPLNDSRRLTTAVDRLDAVTAEDRHAAAKYVFDICIHHVTRVRRLYPTPLNRGQGRPNLPATPTPQFVFDILHPHIYRIARRLDRAMRYAETSHHPADAAALIVAVDAQGALAALFAVAQNAGVAPTHLDLLALPIRKRSAPALLRTLFSPDMRVANAAKKALRQVIATASCQNTPWITTIRSALSLRTATSVNRSIQLQTLLSRLSDILRLVIAQAAAATAAAPQSSTRKRSSRSSLGNLVVRPRQSLGYCRRSTEQQGSLRHRPPFKQMFRKKAVRQPLPRSTSRVTLETETGDRFDRHNPKRSTDVTPTRRSPRTDSVDDMYSLTSAAMSTAGSCPASVFSSVTESGAGTLFSRSHSHAANTAINTIKRDAATAMYIFERLLAKRINPDLDDRILVIDTLTEIANSSFSPAHPHARNVENPVEFREAMKSVFMRHGQHIYSIILDIIFRPAREADANRIGVFSFQEAGIMDIAGLENTMPRRKQTDFPLGAVCLPSMDCTNTAAASINSMFKSFLRFLPIVCSERMALLTGTVNSIFLNCSEALTRNVDKCEWNLTKLTSAVDSLNVLNFAIPESTEIALEAIASEPVTLRLVLETCLRSVGASGRLMAQNTARMSAPKLSDDGTLASLKSWRALVKILPNTSSWVDSPSYSSSILFLAQVARRAALLSVLNGYRREKGSRTRLLDEDNSNSEDTLTMGRSVAMLVNEFEGVKPGEEEGGNRLYRGTPTGVNSYELEEENILIKELRESVIAMVCVPGTNLTDIFFQLYRTVVYLYANDLKKQHKNISRNAGPGPSSGVTSGGKNVLITVASTTSDDKHSITAGPASQMASVMSESRSQSEEDTKGTLVENIAVDGQLPSRALRRAVMASELDLGEYFDSGQPPSLLHLSQHYGGSTCGAQTYEEFAHALAIVLGTLWHQSMMDKHENRQEAVAIIARDVQRSGSSYLKKVHKRARAILRRDVIDSNMDWRNIKYEERIRRLEEQVASLTTMMQSSLEESAQWSRKKGGLPKVLGLTTDTPIQTAGRNEMHDFICSPSKCFCVK